MNAWLELHAPDELDPETAAWRGTETDTGLQGTTNSSVPGGSSATTQDVPLLGLYAVRLKLGAQSFGPFDLGLRAGEHIAILGPSGAGKSTLLKLMAGDLAPGQGRITIGGREIHGWPRAALSRRRAMLPQSHAVAFGLPVQLVVALGRVAREPDPQQSEMTLLALHAARADHLWGRRFDTLSGGEQARVQLARIFAQLWDSRDGLLLVDEPIAALDPGLQFELMDGLREFALARHHALVAVLHDISQALDGFGRLWLVRDGCLVADLPSGRAAVPALERLYGVRLTCVETEDGGFAVVARRRSLPAPFPGRT